MQLSNITAYITGGSKGIGFGIAKALLQQGMKVAISSRNLETAQKAAKSLGENDRVFAVQSDARYMQSEMKAVNNIVAHFGKLDVLIANAGVGHFAPIDEMTELQWKEIIDTNLTGVFNSVKASIDALKKILI